MRQSVALLVSGEGIPTDVRRVVVVGAGLAGLSLGIILVSGMLAVFRRSFERIAAPNAPG